MRRDRVVCFFFTELPRTAVISSEAARWDAEPLSVIGMFAGGPIEMSSVARSRERGVAVVGVEIARSTTSDCESSGIFRIGHRLGPAPLRSRAVAN